MTNPDIRTTARVDFFLLAHEKTSDIFHFTCRLIEKAFRSEHTIYVYVNNQQEAQLLDNQLWSFRPESFVPHMIDNQSQLSPATTPIIISHQPPGNHGTVLINLTNKASPRNQQFQRIFHIVSNNPQTLESARHVFKFYKKQGISPKTTRL